MKAGEAKPGDVVRITKCNKREWIGVEVVVQPHTASESAIPSDRFVHLKVDGATLGFYLSWKCVEQV